MGLEAKEEKNGFILREHPLGNGTILLSEAPDSHFKILLKDIEKEVVGNHTELWWEIELLLPQAPGSKVTKIVAGYMSESNIKKQFNIENKDPNGNILYGKTDKTEVIKKAEPAEEKEEEAVGGVAAAGAKAAKKVANLVSKKVKIVDEATGKDKLVDSNEPITFVGAHKNGWAQTIKLADGSIAYTATSNLRHFSNLIEEDDENSSKANEAAEVEVKKIALAEWNPKTKNINKETYHIPSNLSGVVIKKNKDGWGYSVEISDAARKANKIPTGIQLVTSPSNIGAFEDASIPEPSVGTVPQQNEAKPTGAKAPSTAQKHSEVTQINEISDIRRDLVSSFIKNSDGLKTRSILTPRKTVPETCQTNLDQEIVNNIIRENGSCSKELVALVKATIMQESKWDMGAYRYESQLHLQEWARNIFIPYRNDRGHKKALTNPNHPLRKEFFSSYGLMQFIMPTSYGKALLDREAGKASAQQKIILDKNFSPMRLFEPKTNLYFGIQYLMSHVRKAKAGWANEWMLAAAAGYNSGATGNYAGVHDKYHYKVQNYANEYLKCENADKICKQ